MRHKRTLIFAALLVAVLAAGTAFALLRPLKTSDVAMPPDNASPEQVVRTYLAAMNAHDCRTAEALSTGGGVQETQLWCDDVGSLHDITVHHPFKENPRWSGQPSSVEVMDVAVDFDLQWRRFHDDGSIPEGPNGWGYLLARASANQPWRIFDQGTG